MYAIRSYYAGWIKVWRSGISDNGSAPGVMNDLSMALVMFDGAEEQDVVGPYEMFWWMTAFQELATDRPIKESDFSYTFNLKDGTTPNVFTVAPTTDPIVMSSGMKFIARNNFV